MKRNLTRLNAALCLILAQTSAEAGAGNLFKVTASGAPANLSITLCLNAKAQLSCQTYTVTGSTLNIITALNHTYPDAGIKINTPGYSPTSGCTPLGNGFCSFPASSSTSTMININNSNSGFISVGGYTNTGAKGLPLLAKSMDGKTWSYPSSITNAATLPQNPLFSQGYLTSSSCMNNICVAAGEDNGNIVRNLLLATSSDSGNTWTYPIGNAGTFPTGIIEGFFNSTSCSSTLCAAVGEYYDGSIWHPLATQSVNGGAWTYVIDSRLTTPQLYHYNNDGTFHNTHCSGNTCIAEGSYDDGAYTLPMLAVTTNNGQTWAYAIDGNPSSPKPTGMTSGGFQGSSCSGSVCIASGQYSNGVNTYPTIAASANSGQTWAFTLDSNGPLPNGFNNSGNFSSASCSGSTCIAGGTYSDTSINPPMIATSSNGGATWAYTLTNATPTMPNNMYYGSFLTASCNGNTCIAGGFYYDTGYIHLFPMLATSTNQGQTWTYTVDGSHQLPPAFVNYGQFNSATCQGNTCIAGGKYNNGTNDVPMVITSTDGGQTWAYTIDGTQQLPGDFSSAGVIRGTSLRHDKHVAHQAKHRALGK